MNRDGRPAIPPARGLSAGLELFNKTLQITHIWLDESKAELDRAGSGPRTPAQHLKSS